MNPSATPITIQQTRLFEESWWGNFVGTFLPQSTAYVRRIEEDLALGEDAVGTFQRVVHEPHLRWALKADDGRRALAGRRCRPAT